MNPAPRSGRAPARHRRLLPAALSLALLVAVAACGSDDKADTATTSPAGATSTTAASVSPSTTVSAAGSAGADTTSAASTGGSAPQVDAAAWQQVVDAAKKEGSVTIYSAAPPDTNSLIQSEFEKVYPDIKLEFLRVNSDELSQRFVAEAQGGVKGADALLTVIPATQVEWASNGWLVPLTGPDVTSAQAEPFMIADDTTINAAANVYGYAWNPSAVSDDPKFEDLADPKFKGHIAFYDWKAASTTAINAWIGETYGEDFLTAVAANEPKFYTSTVQIAQDMAAGVVDMSPVMVPAAMANLPLKMVYPDKPVGLPYYASVAANASHPNAAQVWADWSMTPEGQAAWAFEGVSALPNIPGAKYSADQVTVIGLKYYDPAFQTEWTNKLNEIFHR